MPDIQPVYPATGELFSYRSIRGGFSYFTGSAIGLGLEYVIVRQSDPSFRLEYYGYSPWCRTHRDEYSGFFPFGRLGFRLDHPSGHPFYVYLQVFRLFPYDDSFIPIHPAPLILGYFPYNIADDPWPPLVDLPYTYSTFLAAFPLIHSLVHKWDDYVSLPDPIKELVAKHLTYYMLAPPAERLLISFVKSKGVYLFKLWPTVYIVTAREV